MKEREAFLAWSLCQGIGPIRLGQLELHFGSVIDGNTYIVGIVRSYYSQWRRMDG